MQPLYIAAYNSIYFRIELTIIVEYDNSLVSPVAVLLLDKHRLNTDTVTSN